MGWNPRIERHIGSGRGSQCQTHRILLPQVNNPMQPNQLSVQALAVPLICSMMLTACANVRPNPTPPYIIPGGPGDTSFTRVGGQDSGIIFRYPPERSVPGVGTGVNAFLWRGALETLGALPLASADPFGGVILTEWYSPPNTPGERFKETVLILSRDLRGDAVQVSVFHQVDRGGRWIDAPVSPEVQADIRNRVLDRARTLRQQATGQG
jgi:hypothetical protein